jgi:hypothetical protein
MIPALDGAQWVNSVSARLRDVLRRWRVVERTGFVIGIIGVAVVLSGIYVWYLVGVPIHDVHIYELAGDRLNAGGRLYDLRPDDAFPLGEGRDRPLYGPPGIAIPWRILVLLPGSLGVAVWLFVMTWLVLAAMFYVVLGTRGWAGIALILALATPVVLVVGVGNVDCALSALLIVAWVFRSRPLVLGAVVGTLVAVKLTPVVILVWLAATGRWRAVGWAAVSAALVALLAMIATEPGVWIRYAGVAGDLARAGRTSAIGIALLGSLIVLGLGRRRDGIAFAVAVALIPAGSPQAEVHSWAVLLAALAPAVEWVGARSSSRQTVEEMWSVPSRPRVDG